MIITADELAAVRAALEDERQWCAAADLAESRGEDGPDVPSPLPGFFARSPHLLMTLGFDEYATLIRSPESSRLEADFGFEAAWRYGVDALPLCYPSESVYRAIDGGAWFVFDGLLDSDDAFNFLGPTPQPNRRFAVDGFLNLLEGLVLKPDPGPHALWSPHRWTPGAVQERRHALTSAVNPILRELHDGSVELQTLHWRELELVVAEILAARGLRVDVTPRSNDGGRDVVACGELVPGEPFRIAVEVKQKPVVDLRDVQRALRANEDYPALLIATAGRFSAGVLREKRRERNALRLFLKDGVALAQWLRYRSAP